MPMINFKSGIVIPNSANWCTVTTRIKSGVPTARARLNKFTRVSAIRCRAAKKAGLQEKPVTAALWAACIDLACKTCTLNRIRMQILGCKGGFT